MAGTIVVDRLESDSSYTSNITIASPVSIRSNLDFSSSNVTINTAASATATILGSTASAFSLKVKQIQTGNTLPLGFDNTALSEIVAPEAFRIKTNTSTTALYAYQPGYVGLPTQPYFQATYSDATGILRGQYVPWNSLRVNRGSAYNASTRLYTCPIGGIYFVSWTAVRNTGYTAGSGDSFTINRNGVSYVSSYYSSTVVGTVEAAAGDTLGFYYNNDSGTAYLRECYGSIWFLG